LSQGLNEEVTVVSIGLSANAVARIRFAVSCLWEVVASVRVLRRPDLHTVHQPWADRVRAPLAAAGLTGPGSLLWTLVPAEPAYLPDFLTPAPAGLTPDLTTELAALRATPPEVIRAQLAQADLPRADPAAAPPPADPAAALSLGGPAQADPVAALYRDPVAGLDRLAGEIEGYWRIALAGEWPRVRTLLAAEVAARARRLAEDGAAVLLGELHERVTWTGDALTIDARWCAAEDVPDGGGLVLVPSVFVWPAVLTVPTGGTAQLAYPARGVATLWEGPRRAPAALQAVLGRGRARLLVEMRAPVSTTELARRTGMTAGGVSQHLAALRAAGLVTTHRDGKAVLNTRTTVAEALLTAAG
jgi:DNA-binding transcriptional ArsR family regulator